MPADNKLLPENITYYITIKILYELVSLASAKGKDHSKNPEGKG